MKRGDRPVKAKPSPRRLVPGSPAYPVIQDGEWVHPVRRGYLMKCCDCGLVHRFNFLLIPWGRGKKIVFQAFRVPDSRSRKSRHDH